MNNNKRFLCAILPVLSLSFLTGCNKKAPESSEPKPLEIGDTVREWKSSKDLEEAPLGCADKNSEVSIVNDFGNEDKCSLKYEVQNSSKAYAGSDVLEEPYFTEDDAKNGDIISLFVYVPADSNIASLELQVLPISMNKDKNIKSSLLTVDESNTEQWMRLVVSFDTLETLGAIRLNYKLVDTSSTASFYVDDINITYGEETVKTSYEYNDESLYRAYEDYFKIGCCMSNEMLRNTELRKIAKHNFNSLTAENEGKPERILDQKACQELAKEDEGAVAITIEPFKKIYNFCEANHIKVRHHTFVWYSQVPNWFFKKGYKDSGSNVSKEVMLQRMENMIRITLEEINNRWPGLVYAIDVANEAVENHTIRNNNNMWYTVVGNDFVYYAFKYARQYAKEDQKLFYNDWSYDNDKQNLKYALNTLLTSVFNEGLIDGIGIQGHKGINENMDIIIDDAKEIQKKANSLGINLECQFTELDLTISGTSEYSKQKTAYKNLMTKILNGNLSGEMNVTAVVLWGIDDANSWRRGQHALLFTDKYAKKPAYYGFLEALESVQPAEEEASE